MLNYKTNLKKYHLLLTGIFFLSIFYFLSPTTIAVSCDGLDGEAKKICESFNEVKCSDLEGSAREDCEKNDKAGKTYIDILKLKNKQESALNQQLKILDKEQEKTQQELHETKKDEQETSRKIGSLERDITQKEEQIAAQKKILEGLIQAYYEYDQQGLLNIILLDKDFSDITAETEHIEQSGSKVSEVLKEIVKAKNELSQNKEELDEKKEKHEKLKEDLLDKHYTLESSEKQKESLLVQTQGEEEKYKKLLERVEEQKKDLFNFSEASNLAEVDASVKDYPKPDSKYTAAGSGWYFSQRDSRWGSKKIGNSSSLMKDYGCAVASVAMALKKNGANIDPGRLAREKIFYYDLIKWPGSWSSGITLASSTVHGNINWSKIDSSIKEGTPVIVYIKKTNGTGGHYVVIYNKDDKDYIVHDPYFGANLYLGTSKALVGKIGKDSGVRIDQMIIYQ